MVWKVEKEEYKLIDWMWLFFYIMIYSFNVSINNMQKTLVALLFLATFGLLCFYGNVVFIKQVQLLDCAVWSGIIFVYITMSYFWTYYGGRVATNVSFAMLQIFIFCISIDWYIRTPREIRIMFKWFCIASFVFAVIVFVTSPVSTYNSLDFGDFTKQHRNTVAYVLMLATFFDVFMFEKLREKKYLFMAFFCLVVSVLSGSRKVIVGYALALAMWIYWQDDVKKIIKYFMVIVIGLLIAIPIIYKIPFMRDAFGSRLLAIFDDSIEDGSVVARKKAKELAMVLFKESPIIGKGWNAVSTRYAGYWDSDFGIYAHNNFLEVAADFGIIGLLCYYWKFGYTVWNTVFRAREKMEYRFVTICLLVVLVLDYGQVTYWYLTMATVYVLIFKLFQIMLDLEEQETLAQVK